METGLEILGEIHNSHLTALRRCKQKFKYAFIDGIQPKLPSLPLARGIWMHYMLEAQFLKWGIEQGTLLHTPESTNIDGIGQVDIVTNHPEDGPYLVVKYDDKGNQSEYPLSAAGMLKLLTSQVWSKLLEGEKEKYTEDGHTLPEACDRILTEYFYHWKDKPKPKVLLVEWDWQREYKGVTFEGRGDYVIENNGLLICGDWKTTKNEPGPNYKFMESQLNLYPWGLAPLLREYGVSDKKIKAMAVEFDYIATKLPTSPSRNKDGSISKRKINTSRLTLTQFLNSHNLKWDEEQIDEFLRFNTREFFRRDTFPRNMKVVKELLEENVEDSYLMASIVENHKKATRTVSKTCEWDCDFMAVCMGELYGQNVDYILKTQYEPRSNSHAGVVEKEDA